MDALSGSWTSCWLSTPPSGGRTPATRSTPLRVRLAHLNSLGPEVVHTTLHPLIFLFGIEFFLVSVLYSLAILGSKLILLLCIASAEMLQYKCSYMKR